MGCYISATLRIVMTFHIEIDREVDGRWIAEVPDLAGVLTYGATREQAGAQACRWVEHEVGDALLTCRPFSQLPWGGPYSLCRAAAGRVRNGRGSDRVIEVFGDRHFVGIGHRLWRCNERIELDGQTTESTS